MATKYCNLDLLGQNFEGDEDILEELVQDFDDSLFEMFGEIKTSLDAKDFETLERAAHTLKGVISNFFCEELRLICLSMEEKARATSTEGIDSELQVLKLEVPKMILELRDFCTKTLAA